MHAPLLLGIDVGTSSTKAVLCAQDGSVVAAASADHPTGQPRPGWSEQDPRDWWKSSLRAIAGATGGAGGRARDVAAIGLSGQMHGSVFLDRATIGAGGRRGDALRPAILWNDQRTVEQCREIERLAGGRRRLVELAGNAALTGFTLPKILWVREHEPEVFGRTAAIVVPKDYLRFRLTGDLATDVGDASGMLLMSVDSREWSAQLLALAGLEESLLPRVYESGAVTGTISAWAAEQTGLPAGTPVVAGSGDSQAGAVGAGVVAPGLALAAMGTSGVIYAHSRRPLKHLGKAGEDEPPGCIHTKCAATGTSEKPGEWCITGCMLSAAGSLQWCRDALWPGTPYGELFAEAAGVPPGCEGLVFLPYLTGERCPYPDPLARGGWIGLTSRHTRAHLVRAVLEGVTFGMRQVLDLVRSVGVSPGAIRIAGGGAKSELWRQMQADIYGCTVATTNSEEGPAYGAALLAGVGAGVWGSIHEACAACVREVERREGDPVQARRYEPSRAVYSALYHDLKHRFAALAAG